MLDLHTAHGYEEVWPPAIVRRASLRGTGQLPKFEARSVPARDPDRARITIADNDLFLSPTAEVQVTNLHADQILEAGELPRTLLRVLAVLPRRGRRRAARTRAA